MDAEEFRERVEADRRTQLDRLGSGKLLVGLTGGDLRAGPVLELAANSEHAARETFEGWAADESHDGAREAFEAVAAQEADHYERVLALLDGEGFEPAGPGVLHSYLRAREDTVDRVAAGMVGRPLYSVRAYTQMISFFVNEADRATADVLRDLKADTRETLDRGCELVATLCDDDEAEAAVGTAGYAIQLVYDDYADALSELGLNVKSVC